jgi:predicted nuclease of predicted toxin-antitoxin system
MKLLLDAHIPSAVAATLRQRVPGLDVQHIAKWQGGDLLESEDADILTACARDGRIWITYDLATVPELLNRFGEAGQDHSGVFLIDDATIPAHDIGGIAASVLALVSEIGHADTTNLVRYLRRTSR